MQLKTTFLTLISLLFLATSGKGQEEHPKIGLVLSGGGAKGLAHIGTLKVLEELGIVPDYITGTSMGSIIGGLYSIGYTADELEQLALTADWDRILSNKTSLDNIAIEEKPYYGHYQVTMSFENGKIQLPQGLIEGQELSQLLNGLTSSVHGIQDFSQLPRPFKCMGADIENGELVVLESGSLPQAIRASMAIPTVFTPVEVDGKLLVDGGIVQNFPVDQVIEMGADIVIGSLVSDSLSRAEELNSMLDLLNQWMFITAVTNMNEQIKKVDYLIRPKMHPYGTGSFNNADSIVARGDMAALTQYANLKLLADSLKAVRNFEPISKPSFNRAIVVRNVIVNGNSSIPEDLINGKLNISKGDTLDTDELESRIDVMYATRYFEKINYSILPDGDYADIEINVVEAPKGITSFNLHFDTENSVGLLTNLEFRQVGLPNSRLIVETDISEVFFFRAEYFTYMGRRQNSAVSLGINYYTDQLPAFNLEGQTELTLKSRLRKFYLNFQSTRRQNSTLGIRLFSERNTIKPEIVADSIRIIDKIHYSNIGFKPYYFKSNLDEEAFPSRGSSLALSFTYMLKMKADILGANGDKIPLEFERNFWSIDFDYTKHFGLTSRWVISMSHFFRMTNKLANEFNVSDITQAGGFKPNFENPVGYWGGHKYEFGLTSVYIATVMARMEPWHSVFFTAGLNYLETKYPMAWIDEEYFDILPAGDRDRRLGFYFEAAYESIAGPLRIGIAGDVNRSKLFPFVSIGYNFRNFSQP